MDNNLLTNQNSPGMNEGSYEQRRQKFKSNIFSGCLVFFKSTVGLGLLVSQYFFGQAGLLLGTCTTILSCLIICYTMSLIISVADKLERESHDTLCIENYDQITDIIYGQPMMIVTKIFCFLFNEGIILVNITNLARFLLENFEKSVPSGFEGIDFFKLVAVFLILLSLVFIIEPEMIKYPSYLAAFILFFATFIMWVMSYFQLFKNGKTKPFEYMNFMHFPSLVGNQLYAFESIGTLFTVRSTLQSHSQMHKVLKYTFVLIFLLFAINGISFLIVV